MMFIGLVHVLLSASTPNATEYQYRLELERAIQSATDDTHKQALLRRIATEESNWRSDVGSCVVKGDAGRALGPFQIHPRSPSEKQQTCSSTTRAATLALARIEESLRVCSALPNKWKLSAYCSGSCALGHAASERRWVEQ